MQSTPAYANASPYMERSPTIDLFNEQINPQLRYNA